MINVFYIIYRERIFIFMTEVLFAPTAFINSFYNMGFIKNYD